MTKIDNPFSFDLLFYDEIDSTNKEAARIVKNQNNPGFKVICSNSQTSGKGREDKNWISPKGNIYMTIILPKTSSLNNMAQVSFIASLAIHKILKNIFNQYNIEKKIELKWPNDVLVDDKKISGILIESISSEDEFILIGIGINVYSHPKIKDYATTSLENEGVYFIENDDVITTFLKEFSTLYKTWLINNFIPIRDEWLRRAKNIGKLISVKTKYNRVYGRFIDIDLTGAIRLKVSSGQIHSINTGEVFFE